MKNTDDKRPRGIADVQNIEVSESNIKPRAILAAVFLLIGIAAVGIAVHSLLNVEPGWQTVEISLSEPSAADEFALDYLFGSGDMSPAAERKLIERVYGDACTSAYKLFTPELLFEGVNNIAYINSHINEEISVDPVLYEAFAKIEAAGSRYLYLAPIYGEYDAAFFGIEMPESVSELDPYFNEEFAGELKLLAEYCASPEHISVELLGGGKIRLLVSAEYEAFAYEYGITEYIDFYRMKNAFVIDYLASVLENNGFGRAVLTSYDGYVRYLGDGECGFNMFDRKSDGIYKAAELYYTSPCAAASLFDYPANEREAYNYYMYDDRIITPFIDYSDGLYRTAASNMIMYSSDFTCADIILQMLPIYISESVDISSVSAMSGDGIYAVWCRDGAIYHTEREARIGGVYQGEDREYTVVFAEEKY